MNENTLENWRGEFSRRKFFSMPIAGLIVWTALIVTGHLLPEAWASLAIFIGTGSIVYIGMLIAWLTGESFFRKGETNPFDVLFLVGMVQALLVFSIAIPFFLLDRSSLPLSVGILTGLMWLPFSWIIRHWIGFAHAIGRTFTVLALWYGFPSMRFTVIPIAIVILYIITLVVLGRRFRTIHKSIETQDAAL
jgi:hypothetical protein